MSQDINKIRNFCIIAHVDHGKSTLADRFLELTQTIEKRKMREQYLDQLELERERGITIKMAPVRMVYHPQNQISNIKDQNEILKNKNYSPEANSKILPFDFYILNLIDTPGHVDFSYEVSRALAAVEGAVLLVDAAAGIQAQTLANLEKARERNLAIVPVINKIDLPQARIVETKNEVSRLLNCSPEDILEISAKTGQGIAKLLERIIEKIPPPHSAGQAALIFDSLFDVYKGAIAYIRVFNGNFSVGDRIYFLNQKIETEVEETGIFKPEFEKVSKLESGEIGYIITGLKDISKVRVGETIVKSNIKNQISKIPEYKEPKPLVFANFYTSEENDYQLLKKSLAKLKLNDASLFFEEEAYHTGGLGRGFRCGFLGLLHLDITQERLKREYNVAPIITAPRVAYLPGFLEPWAKVKIITPTNCLGAILELLKEARAFYKNQIYLSPEKVLIEVEAPLAELIQNFYDKIQSVSQGLASLDYEFLEYRAGDLVKLDILIAGEKFEAFSRIAPRQKVYQEARRFLKKLKEVLPKQLFSVSLQAAINGKIIAREDIGAKRKDVTGYLYGGDITRKMKLLEKQKRGKQHLKETGKIKISPDVFLKILEINRT